ncbi:MAG: LarC family nickel insertion protein [Lachnospira sp.]
MNKLYLECFSGISGDMAVAALLDCGADKDELVKYLDTLPLTGYKIEIKKIIKNGLSACDFNVILDDELENHDHDMEYLYGHLNGHTHIDMNEHEHSHIHVHKHGHRTLKDVLDIINGGNLTPGAREIAEKIFTILGEAEAKAHGTDLSHVHFHEVGAVDSIIDIAAFAICLDNLGIKDVIVPVLYEGCGTVRCAHGILPIPVPAVANIVSAHHIKIHLTNISGELVTPTGAAIVAAVTTETELPAEYEIIKIGLGAGKRNYETAGFVRAMIICSN